MALNVDFNAASLRRFFASPMAKVAQDVILWLLRWALSVWAALQPSAHLPALTALGDEASNDAGTDRSVLMGPLLGGCFALKFIGEDFLGIGPPFVEAGLGDALF